jgi:hypothetical protein
MSVPAIITLTCVSEVERVESYILNLVNRFYKARHVTSIILLNDNKAVLPALDRHYRSIPVATYKYELNFGCRVG